MSSLYDILEVSPAASNEVIKAAYKKLTMRYHPDRNQDEPGAEEYQKRLNAAYEVLSDPLKRQAYDESLNPLFQASAAWAAGETPFAEAEHAPPRQEPPSYAPPHQLPEEPRNPWLLAFMLIPAIAVVVGIIITGIQQVM